MACNLRTNFSPDAFPVAIIARLFEHKDFLGHDETIVEPDLTWLHTAVVG